MSRAGRTGAALIAAWVLLAVGGRIDLGRGGSPAGDDAGAFVAVGPAIARAASPAASPPTGDTRSAGEGPGLVGAPFLAIGGVLALGVATAGLTVLYVRLSGGSRAPSSGAGPRRGHRREP